MSQPLEVLTVPSQGEMLATEKRLYVFWDYSHNIGSSVTVVVWYKAGWVEKVINPINN